MSTESLENLCMNMCYIALFSSFVDITTNGFRIYHLITIPSLGLGWINALSIKAISETIGIENTNNAIFGYNYCQC